MSTIIYPPTIPWNWMVQRPQQLMKQLSLLGYTVFYEDIGSFTQPRVHKLSDTLYLCQGISPLTLPQPRPCILWLTFPTHVQLIKQYRPDYVVFDCSDEPKDEFAEWERFWPAMLTQANLVFASSSSLFQRLSLEHPLVQLVPNGVDFQHFSTSQNNPPDLPKNKPIVGYSGAIAPWLDWDLLQEVISQNPAFHFIFIGALLKLTHFPLKADNLSYLGLKSYSFLPAYLQYFKIGLIPFKQTAMTQGCNPIKLYEYAAAGLPIVATPLPELSRSSYPSLYLASDPAYFSESLFKALIDPINEAVRKSFALENDWKKRAEKIHKTLQKYCI